MSRCDCAGAPLYRCPKCGAKGIAEGKRPDMSTETPITDATVAAVDDMPASRAAYAFLGLSRKLERDRAALIAALREVERYSAPGDDLTGNEVEMLSNCYSAARATLAAVQS